LEERIMFRMTAMDHIVLNVRDMGRVLDFYQNVLGLQAERLAEYRRGEVPFPSVRINADTVIDLFPVAESDDELPERSDLNHFCLVLSVADMPPFMEHLRARGVRIEEGPATRWGAHGNGTSIYFCDPESRRIEVRCYAESTEAPRP
jgi:catechol 2,3-dioxygenase-like lactoylglutathione lyase family enzyme